MHSILLTSSVDTKEDVFCYSGLLCIFSGTLNPSFGHCNLISVSDSVMARDSTLFSKANSLQHPRDTAHGLGSG